MGVSFIFRERPLLLKRAEGAKSKKTEPQGLSILKFTSQYRTDPKCGKKYAIQINVVLNKLS
jgi:hypothetical protein